MESKLSPEPGVEPGTFRFQLKALTTELLKTLTAYEVCQFINLRIRTKCSYVYTRAHFPHSLLLRGRIATRDAWHQSTLLCQGTAMSCVIPSVYELIEAFQIRHIQADLISIGTPRWGL